MASVPKLLQVCNFSRLCCLTCRLTGIFALLPFVLGLVSSLSLARTFRPGLPASAARKLAGLEAVTARTAVLYIFSDGVPEYINNLKFFVRWGIREADGADYFIVVQGVESDSQQEFPEYLPTLPRNARYIPHKNECYDWGTFGWLLESGKLRPEQYKYLVLLNSSVRGPFIPPYLPAEVPWHHLFTQRLTPDIKLVGSTISCEPISFGNGHVDWRQNPHVQSFVVAMDQEALGILKQSAHVLECWNSRWDAIWYAELGSSKAILDAGFNIASFLTRYQGIDWRNQSNWGCNEQRTPLFDDGFDGFTLMPYDTVFVKFKDSYLMGNMLKSLQTAARYQSWMEAQSAPRDGNLENT